MRQNFLIIMTDQLNGTLFPDGPVPWLHTPHLARLAEQSVRFCNSYTASPLCSPARAAFMTGMLPSRCGVYDNAAEFRSELPTFAHYLRNAGYFTCLSGKMHFVGPDQLHGFEQRLTTDIYPADFGWTPDFTCPEERVDWWYHNLGSVVQSGVAEATNQYDYDDEVTSQAAQKLYDLARTDDQRPWLLTASYTHPHDPYVARRQYWNLYEGCSRLSPEINGIAFKERDPHSQRILAACDYERYLPADEQIRSARRAYFANISYLDEQVGRLLSVLKATDQADNTAVMFLSDHGDMIGEKGLWFKMSFLEGSSRIPLLLHAKGLQPRTVRTPVSLLDIAPTLTELAGADMSAADRWCDGESLVGLASGQSRDTPVLMEYAAEASGAPMVSVVAGRWKFIRCRTDPDMLFNLQTDPHELVNLADSGPCKGVLRRLEDIVNSRWNLETFEREVRSSQARRHLTYTALRKGHYSPWDFQPGRQASECFVRNHLDLNAFERQRRL